MDARERLARARLMLVVAAPESERVAAAALRGGADAVQLRELSLSNEAAAPAAAALRRLCDAHDALFVVALRPDLARAGGADGVHLERREEVEAARRQLGEKALVGLSLERPERVEGVDYLFVGPVHSTPTKPGHSGIGLDAVREAARTLRVPFFAVGGIDGGNVRKVAAAGARRIAVIRAIAEAADPEAAARALRAALAEPADAAACAGMLSP